MKKQATLFTLSLITLACMKSSFAAIPVNLKNQNPSILKSLAISPTHDSFKQVSSDVDFNHVTHIRIQQMYAGYPVWGADGVVHIPQNSPRSLANLDQNSTMNGIIYKGLLSDLNKTPVSILNLEQGKKALQHAKQIYWKTTGINNYDDNTAKSDLIVYVDKNNIAHWAYLVSFLTGASDGMPALPTYIMDAQTFFIYTEWNDIQTAEDVKGGGYGGNQKMGKFSYDGLSGNYPVLDIKRLTLFKRCLLQNSDVQVKDDNRKPGPLGVPIAEFQCNVTDSQHANLYWNGDSDAVNGGYSPANDALYIGRIIKDMYQKWYGIPVLTQSGKPMKLNMHIHTRDFTGQPMDNAYFLSINKEMYFGDGVSYFYPLTSLGVGAHEVSHGFTSQHSKLIYQKQSGGLNEAFSDMAAQAAEFYSTGHNSWQIGPEILKGEGALRYMDEPTKDGNSIDNIKDYNDNLNVHYTSGIFNKAFYLLGTAENWNTKKAFDVMVKANMHYWTSNITFADAACGVIKATQDYKYDINAVVKAMNGVGINTAHCLS